MSTNYMVNVGVKFQ